MSSAAVIGTINDYGLLSTEVVSSTSEFAALREEWTDLVQSSDSDCLFLSWEWLYTWWRHLGVASRLSLVTVRSLDRLVGLAPFCINDARRLGGSLMPTVGFLGTGFVGSDYLDCIVRRGYESGAVAALGAHFGRRRILLDCRQVRREENCASKLAGHLEGTGWSRHYQTTNVCPYIPLRGVSWDDYLGSLGAEHRYAFHRKLKRLQRDHAVRFEAVRREQECRDALDVTIDLHNRRWNDRGGSDAFHTRELVGFHRDFTTQALQRGWLRLYVLWVDGKAAACIYGFLYGGKFYFYQSGFDIQFEKQSVGLVAMGLAIRSAIEEGAIEYDLLHGDEPYKSHWSRLSREIGRLESYPPGRLSALYRSSIELERASRRFAKRVIPRRLFQ